MPDVVILWGSSLQRADAMLTAYGRKKKEQIAKISDPGKALSSNTKSDRESTQYSLRMHVNRDYRTRQHEIAYHVKICEDIMSITISQLQVKH